MVFCSKENLYNEVNRLKNSIGFNPIDYNIDLVSFCKSRIHVEELNFTTKKLRGMAIVGDSSNKDIILLNKNRTHTEQCFDCGHEFIHLAFHRNIKQKTFNCLDEPTIKQDSYLEWQANEGAAEFFVPYRSLLPLVKARYEKLDSWAAIQFFKAELAETYNVSLGVIHYRLESLKYEIAQYVSGISIDDVKILSHTQQAKKKIKVSSINDKEMQLYLSESYSQHNY